MRVLLFLSLFALSNTSLLAKTCKFENDSSQSKVGFTAYKTPKKVGVNGTFTKAEITAKSKKKIEAVLKSAKFSIDSQSVASGDKARDTKIALYFFKTMMPNQSITGEVVGIDEAKKQLKTKISMNGVSQEVMMDYKLDGNKFSASGVIDVLNFKMDNQLKALGLACSEKHEKKTWSEVAINVESAFKEVCK